VKLVPENVILANAREVPVIWNSTKYLPTAPLGNVMVLFNVVTAIGPFKVRVVEPKTEDSDETLE